MNAGESAQTLATDHIERVLRMRELTLLARTKEPEFRPLLDRARAFFAARLPDLARMVAIDDAKDYAELVRRAFPERKEAQDIVHANAAHVTSVVADLKTHPHLLRVPHAWVPRIAGIAHDMVEWQTARVLASVERIYATTDG